jgi:acyl-CoA reductase-like NAD-dependent aldehyde dehydrogenase
VPPAVFQNLVLDHATTASLIGSKSFGFVNFTGSVAGGKAMEEAAAGTFTAVGTRARWQGPGYVMRRCRPGCTRSTPGRRRDLQLRPVLLRHRAHLRVREVALHEFVDKAVDLVKYKLGNPMHQAPRWARWRNVSGAETVRSQIADALARRRQSTDRPAKKFPPRRPARPT